MSDSLQPRGLQHTRLLCPALSPRVCSNLWSLSWWCYLTISSSAALFSFCFQCSQNQGFFQQLILCIRWPKYWGFSFSPSNEFSGLISFRIDWFDLLVVQRTLKEFSPASQFESINSSVLNLFYCPTLTSIHDHWEKTIALTIWTFVGKVVSLFFNMLSRFVITFLPRSKCLLISWRQPLQMLVHWIPIAFLVIYFLIQGNYNSLCSEGFPKESNHIRLDVICI